MNAACIQRVIYVVERSEWKNLYTHTTLSLFPQWSKCPRARLAVIKFLSLSSVFQWSLFLSSSARALRAFHKHHKFGTNRCREIKANWPLRSLRENNTCHKHAHTTPNNQPIKAKKVDRVPLERIPHVQEQDVPYIKKGFASIRVKFQIH